MDEPGSLGVSWVFLFRVVLLGATAAACCGRNDSLRLAGLVADIQTELESLKRFDHLRELLQSQQLSVNDECDLAI